MKSIVLFCLVNVMFFSCEKVIPGDGELNDPERNFELFWNDFDKHYSLFYIKGTNWDSLYQVYRPQVTANTSQPELWSVMTHMIECLNDSHTVLYNEQWHIDYSSGYRLNEKAIKEEFSLNLIKRTYVEQLTRIESEDDLQYGNLKNRDIGYIFLRKTQGDNPEEAIAELIGKLGAHKAIILDLRTNAGGFAFYSKIFAGMFADGEHLIGTVQMRNGPRHADFSEKTNEVTQRTGADQFLKPVIVLTDRATISGGEYLTLHMKSFAHVTQIGDTTAGDFGAAGIRRFLPIGWTYTYSIKMFLLKDGTSLDGKGIPPDVFIKNANADISAGKDQVLETAIRYLFDTYGIE